MGCYEIVIESYIDKKRIRDFEGMEIVHLPDGNTLFKGYLLDQAQLYMVLNRVRDMNLTLLSIKKDNYRLEGLL
jgi:hypothetical protein